MRSLTNKYKQRQKYSRNFEAEDHSGLTETLGKLHQ